MTKQTSWTQFRNQVMALSKDDSHLSNSQLEAVVEMLSNYLNRMPDVDSNGRFLADRKIWLSTKILQLQASIVDRKYKLESELV